MPLSDLPRRTAAVLLITLVLQASGLPPLSVGAAAATPPPKLVILPMVRGEGAPDGSERRFGQLLSGELEGRPEEVRLVKPGAGTSASSKTADDAAALASLKDGQGLLEELKFEAAAAALKKGIDGLTAAPERIDFGALIDGYVSLAVASFRMGDEDGAQAALLAVAKLAPAFRLPDGKYPPIFVREFDRAKRRAEKLPKANVKVEGPAGATAFVDGRHVGLVPAIAEHLAAGRHFVRVEGTRGESFGAAVDVKGGTVRVKATFAPASVAGAVGPILDAEAVAAADAAVRAVGADFGLVGVVFRSAQHQLTAATALYSAKHQGFRVLERYVVDLELVTANVEAFKLADEISDAVSDFPPAALLPVNLAEGSGFKASIVASAPESVELAPARRSALGPPPRPADPKIEALSGTHLDVDAARLDPTAGSAPGEVRRGAPWWVWTLVGVGVAAAAGGTYYGVTQASQPVTGTVTARW